MERSHVQELIDSAEWACSWGDTAALRSVCLELQHVVTPACARSCAEFVRLMDRDEDRAMAEWSALRAALRDEPSGRAARG